MTYSRPQTSQVNAYAPVARPNEPQAAPRQIVNTTPNGNLRVVDLGVGNAGSGAGEIKSFFDGILNLGPKIIEPIAIERANRQVGEILANTDLQGALRRNDEATLGMVKRLSPRAQDLLQTGMAGIATEEYVKGMGRKAAYEPLLLNPKGDNESDFDFAARQAQGRANIRSAAMAESGIGNLPAQYRGMFALKAMEGESLVMQGVRKEQDESYNKVYNSKMADMYAFSIGSATAQVTMGAQPEGALQIGQNWYNAVADKMTPLVAAENMMEGVRRKYVELVAQGRYQDAQSVLKFLDQSMVAPIQTAVNGDLYSVNAGPRGESMRTLVADLTARLKPEMEKADMERNYTSLKDLLPGIIAGDPMALEEANARLVNMSKNPEQFSSALAVIRGAAGQRELAEKPTPEQQQVMLAYTLDKSRLGANIGDLNERIFADTRLSATMKASLITVDTGKSDAVTESVRGAREYNSPQIKSALERLYDAAARNDKASVSTPEGARDVQQKLFNFAVSQATQNTEIRLNALRDAGKPFNDDIASSYFRNELEAVTAGQLKKMGAPVGTRRTVQEERRGEMNYIQQQLNKTGGITTLSTFPKTLLDDAKANGVPTDNIRKLKEFTLKRLGAVQETNDSGPANKDAGILWRDMVKKAQSGNLRPSLDTGGQPASGGLSLPKVQSLIQRFLPSLDTSSSMGPGNKQQRPAAGQLQMSKLGAELGGNLLAAAINVVVPPAQAREASANIISPERMKELSLAYKNSRERNPAPMSLRQGTLPQVAANTPVAPVPLAISTDKHPFFVAVGINEGTRTPAGGYTKAYFGHRDPGDKNWNVGTVSGGGKRGGGGTPQVVDRTWAGKLTQRAMAAAPFIVARGVQQGTAGFNRVLFNYLDLMVQAPAAASDFLRKLPQMQRAGLTIEAIAKARTDSFYYPNGKWGGVWSYPRMLQDQRARAGTFDYKARLGGGDRAPIRQPIASSYGAAPPPPPPGAFSGGQVRDRDINPNLMRRS